MDKPRIITAFIILGFLLQACSATIETAPNPTPTLLPKHRIGIRVVDGVSEFFDRLSGEKFIPRGANYHRWVARSSPGQGTIPIDSLFNTAYGQLDQAEEELRQMAAMGFNTVRVWKNACWGGVGGCIGNPAGGLSSKYLDNITEFLRMAKRHGIYVILTDDWVPEDGGYNQELNRACCSEFNGYNMVYLTEYGITAESRYWEDLIQGLIERGAPLDAVLAYELKNEAFYEAQLPPLNRTSGMVKTSNGNTYDMANAEDRIRMMEEGWLSWIEQLRNSILSKDPTALVTMGFFVQQEPHAVRQGDTRLVYLERVVRESQLDFLDFHAYPGYDLSIKEHAENFTMTGNEDKLIIMGEFGAAKDNYHTLERAAAGLQSWQIDSCELGFDGWLLWTWGENPGAEFWNALDGEGIIGASLSPMNRSDPCAYGEFDSIRFNVAPQAIITASSAIDGFPPQYVADGTSKHWNAAALSPQWVEFALPVPADFYAIELTVAQDPPGRSVHEIWLQRIGEELTLMHTFDGRTAEGDVLTFRPEKPIMGVNLVRVVTKSVLDLWPAWHEIEILTATPPG